MKRRSFVRRSLAAVAALFTATVRPRASDETVMIASKVPPFGSACIVFAVVRSDGTYFNVRQTLTAERLGTLDSEEGMKVFMRPAAEALRHKWLLGLTR